MVDNILSQILYGMSGFFFAIFSCRYGNLATEKMKAVWLKEGFSLGFLLSTLPSVLFLTLAIFIFPLWFYTRTQTGAFVYLATYIFYSMKKRG